jgi:hypothetical protein
MNKESRYISNAYGLISDVNFHIVKKGSITYEVTTMEVQCFLADGFILESKINDETVKLTKDLI